MTGAVMLCGLKFVAIIRRDLRAIYVRSTCDLRASKRHVAGVWLFVVLKASACSAQAPFCSRDSVPDVSGVCPLLNSATSNPASGTQKTRAVVVGLFAEPCAKSGKRIATAGPKGNMTRR